MFLKNLFIIHSTTTSAFLKLARDSSRMYDYYLESLILMENDLVPPGLTYLTDNIISRQNILGVAKEQSARWAQTLNLPDKAETLFFAGCGYQYSNHLETLMSLVRGIDKSVIGAELPLRFARFQKKLGLNFCGFCMRMCHHVRNMEYAIREAQPSINFFS